MSKKQEQFEYKAEMKQLLHLIIHSLYTHPEVFLRELISNASDAMNKARFKQLTDKNILDADKELKINISIDPKEQTFSIEDNGIGMSKEELTQNLGTIAKSGTLEFFTNLKKNKEEIDANMIGQFGVGFYSIFMVTDEVTVETRNSDKDGQGYTWKSVGEQSFTIEESDKTTRGTKISFKLKDEYKEFAEDYKIKSTIQKYSNFVDFPVFVGEEQVNKSSALWHKPKSETTEEELNEFYKYLTNDSENPTNHIQLSIEGNINFKALIFIPSKSAPMQNYIEQKEKSIQLYTNKVMIQEDCKDILPEYLRFVKGVVDTPDLPLNVSREVTQSSPVMMKIKQVLTTKILNLLENMAKNDSDKYTTFHKEFGAIFKLGLNTDFANKDKLVELFRFQTTMTDENEFISFKDYVSRMREEQKEIYYLTGEHKELLWKNPNLEYFRKKEIEVILLSEPIDLFVIPSIPEYDKKALKSIDKDDIDIKTDKNEDNANEIKKEALKSLLEGFKNELGDKISDVKESKRLVDSPVTLVSAKDALDPQMERMMKMINQDYKGTKKILEINLDHPIIRNLNNIYEKDAKDPLFKDTVMQLFEGALLLDGTLESPLDYVKRMNSILEKATTK